MNKQKIISIVVIAVSVIVMIVGLVVLPNEIVFNPAGTGEGTSMSKYLGMLIIPALSGLSVYSYLKSEDDLNNLILAIIGIVIGILMILVNI